MLRKGLRSPERLIAAVTLEKTPYTLEAIVTRCAEENNDAKVMQP